MAFSLHRTLVNGAVLKTKSEHGRICFFAVEDAFDFSIKFEKMSPIIAISILSIVIYVKKIAMLNIKTKRFDYSPY